MTCNTGRLAGKVAMVTASTRGIGYAIVKRFAEEGATVYMAARNAERAQAKIDELRRQSAGNGEVRVQRCLQG